jgi:ureidoacrylate peracid hydrolase
VASGDWTSRQCRAALAAAERLAASAAPPGVPVVFVGLFTTPETDSRPGTSACAGAAAILRSSAALCRAGEPGSGLRRPQPAPGEPVVRKTRYSGFWDTDIDARLKAWASTPWWSPA